MHSEQDARDEGQKLILESQLYKKIKCKTHQCEQEQVQHMISVGGIAESQVTQHGNNVS